MPQGVKYGLAKRCKRVISIDINKESQKMAFQSTMRMGINKNKVIVTMFNLYGIQTEYTPNIYDYEGVRSTLIIIWV